MFNVLSFLGRLLASMRRSRVSRDAEVLFLRQLRRSAPTRLRLRNTDRLIFVWLYRLFPSLLDAAVIFKPETLVRWHCGGFRLFWRWIARQITEAFHGIRHLDTSSAIEIAPTARWSHAGCKRWASATDHSHPAHHGKTAMLIG